MNTIHILDEGVLLQQSYTQQLCGIASSKQSLTHTMPSCSCQLAVCKILLNTGFSKKRPGKRGPTTGLANNTSLAYNRQPRGVRRRCCPGNGPGKRGNNARARSLGSGRRRPGCVVGQLFPGAPGLPPSFMFKRTR